MDGWDLLISLKKKKQIHSYSVGNANISQKLSAFHVDNTEILTSQSVAASKVSARTE